MKSFWTKKGKAMPIADEVTDFVEEDICEFPNQFKHFDRGKLGFGWYEYETQSGSFTHQITENKIINEPLVHGVIKQYKGERYVR